MVKEMVNGRVVERMVQFTAQAKDLGGGVKVRRLLPAAQRQGIGPFLFLDHFGPLEIRPRDVREVQTHPHIGISTVTYLFEGALQHRDSLERSQRIAAGSVNWMTAGCGIAHSESAPEDLAHSRYVNHGVQLWAALPIGHEEDEPDFCHVAAADVPQARVGDAQVRVLAGAAFGCQSPVSPLLAAVCLDVTLPKGGVFELPALAQELGVYTVDADVAVDSEPVPLHTLALLPPGQTCTISNPSTNEPCRLLVFGGDPLDAPRFMWWNFVSSRKERVAEAAQQWSAHAFGYVVGDSGIVALPDQRGRKDRRGNRRSSVPAKDRRD